MGGRHVNALERSEWGVSRSICACTYKYVERGGAKTELCTNMYSKKFTETQTTAATDKMPERDRRGYQTGMI